MNHPLASAEFVLRPSMSHKICILASLLTGFASLTFAEKAADISDDFIEYLGQMEDSDDSWADFEEQTKQDTTTHGEHSSVTSVTSARSRDDGKTVSGRSRP